MSIGQWFCYGIVGIFQDMDVDPALALLAVSRLAEADWDARPDLIWFLSPFGEKDDVCSSCFSAFEASQRLW